MNLTMEQLINDFLKIKRIRSKKEHFYFRDGKNSLLSLMENNGEVSLNEDSLTADMREIVMALPRGKETAIYWFREFWKYLKTQGVVEGAGKFPNINICNAFERRIFIAKYLQDPLHRIDDLEELLWVSKRTIEGDLQILRGNDPVESIQICGKKFVIPETNRSGNHLYMASTTHPLFLTSNLTQVITMLRGLKLLRADPALAAYSRTQAEAIWQQLSEYAKSRILYVTEHLLPDDLDWYYSLETNETKIFLSEKNCSHYGSSCVTDCLKNGKACYIEYRAHSIEPSVFYENCLVKCVDISKGIAQIQLEDGKLLEIKMEGILASAESKEELI